ncbi:hypothetical protein ACV367_33425, partial [Pseudomonas aeruginosa]
FLGVLHDHLHRLAGSAMPLGLHTFGVAASPELRLGTVMQQLGEPYYRALGLDPDELFAAVAQVALQRAVGTTFPQRPEIGG